MNSRDCLKAIDDVTMYSQLYGQADPQPSETTDSERLAIIRKRNTAIGALHDAIDAEVRAAVARERDAAVAYIRRAAKVFPSGTHYEPAIVLESIAEMLEDGEPHAQVHAPKVGDYVRVRWPPSGLKRPVGRVVEVKSNGVLVDHGDGEVYAWTLNEVRYMPETVVEVSP